VPTRDHEPHDAPEKGRPKRARLTVASMEERARLVEERAQAARQTHRSVDVVFRMADRDVEVGGGIIAGALAYRLFVWVLPLALVAVAGLGMAADASSTTPEDAAESVGLAGLVSQSIASAAESSNRWYALLVGIPLVVWTTRSLLRALIGAHRLVWMDVRADAPRPTPAATLRLLVLLVAGLLVSGSSGAVRAWSGAIGLLATVLLALPYAALWLGISTALPHRGSSRRSLVPGALLFGIGIELLHLVGTYVIAPWAITKRGTYGALGAAAALLLGLYLMSRLVVGTAVVNATLWELRARQGEPPDGRPAPGRP
jgi:uncharacterized BrkB/YihY/UPF0761 family membrane protein